MFDFGGVLATSPFELIRTLGAAAGNDGDELLELLLGPYAEDTDHPWHRVERGEIPLADYVTWLTAEAKARNITLPRSPLAEMVAHEPVVDKARELRADGYKTAVLTNNAREVGDRWRAIVPLDDFDVVVDSSEVGMRKPNPRIYLHTADLLGVAPERVVFLDDAPGNVAGAEQAGMRGILVGEDIDVALTELEAILAGTA